MFLFEVQVALASDGDKMDMCMGNFQTDDGNGDALARNGFLDLLRHFLCEDHHSAQFLIFDVEDIVRFMFGNNQGMAF